MNDIISLVGAGVILGLCELTIYSMRRIGAQPKRYYLNEDKPVNKYREGQFGFDFDKTGDIRYFITAPKL